MRLGGYHGFGFVRLSGVMGSLPVMVMTLQHYRNTPPPGGSAVAVAITGCTLVPNFNRNYAVHLFVYAYDVMQIMNNGRGCTLQANLADPC